MQLFTYVLLTGLVLCISGFMLAMASLGIVIYNYQHSNDDYLRFERIVIDTVAQVSVFIGFLIIYYYVITNIKESGKW